MKTQRPSVLMRNLLMLLIAFPLACSVLAQGDLTPPGAPAPAMKTLDQIEPRTPISVLPYTINQPGSYYLATNLYAGADTGIRVEADGVTLDLMGFELVGGNGSGITVNGIRRNLSIRNGTIRDWTGHGIRASDPIPLVNAAHESQFHDLRIFSNAEGGLISGEGSLVTRCTVSTNGGHGIRLSHGSTISQCTVTANGSNGVHIASGSKVLDSTARENLRDGFDISSESIIRDCVSVYNKRHGVEASAGSIIRHVIARFNDEDGIRAGAGCTIEYCNAANNGRTGIDVNTGNMVRHNTSRFNSQIAVGVGIRAESGNRIEDNDIRGNTPGGLLVVGGGNFIVRNTAAANGGLNYSFALNNITGTIVNVTGGGVITTGNSWANFEY